MKSHVVNRKGLEKKAWNDPSLLLKVRWSGINFYEMVLPNGKTVVMDPCFDTSDDGHNEHNYTPTELSGGEWVHGADYIILTHAHGDHTGALQSVLEHYPNAQVFMPEFSLPMILWQEKVNPVGHYITPVAALDKLQVPGMVMETCRSNHNLARGCSPAPMDPARYALADGSVDFVKLFNMVYGKDIMNVKITTDEGFTVLIWNSEMQADGMGYETRPWFYRDAQPDLFMYQVAGASFDYNRRNPNCQHMGEWIASVKGKAALPEHQQHFSYEELDAMGEKFSAICNEKGVSTAFLTPETGVWYGYSKDAEGNVQVCLVEE